MKKNKIMLAAFSLLTVMGMLTGCSGDSPNLGAVSASKPSSSEAQSSKPASSAEKPTEASSEAQSEQAPDVPETSETSETPDTSDTSDSTEAPPAPAEGEGSSVKFSKSSGFYGEKISLEMTTDRSDATIYYTTNGTEPTEDSERYSGPITLTDHSFEMNILASQTGVCPSGDFRPMGGVDKANVIRAAAFYPDGTRSEIVSGTYFIGIDHKKKYAGVPVISMFTDKKNLFDYEKGIYVLGKAFDDWKANNPDYEKVESWAWTGNFSMRGKDWERPVTIEYLDENGETAFVQDFGMRIKGAASRSAMQKSFRIIAREEYGNKNVKYELIPDNPRSDGEGNVEKYKSFVLRNGGNDCDYAKLRDQYLQEMVWDRRVETEQYCPCVVFIDGEYWGMYSLVEDYTDNYIEQNYGIEDSNVVMIKRNEVEEGEDGDIELYNEMHDFITQNDMTKPENYKKAGEYLDLGSFADYCAFNLYIFNEDSMFKNNNWEMWRVRTPDDTCPESDGRWRMLVYDVDYAAGIYNDGTNFKQNNFGIALKKVSEDEGRRPVNIFVSLYENDDFKREFVNALCDIRNISFEKNAALKVLDERVSVYKQLAPDTFKRFGPDWLLWNPAEYYQQKIDGLSGFISGRYDAIPDIMQKALKLSEQAELSLDVTGGGAVKINASEKEISGSFKGTYFTDYPITLKAEAGDKKFVRWETKNCTVSDETAEEITVTFKGDFSVKAIFE